MAKILPVEKRVEVMESSVQGHDQVVSLQELPYFTSTNFLVCTVLPICNL